MVLIFQFERSLVLYHRGFRLRVELYGDAFKEGIEKTTSSIICGLANLNAELQAEAML